MSQPATWNVPQAADAPVTPAAYAARDKDSLDALLSSHEGTARPAYAVAGTIWKSSSTGLWYFYDGTNDLPLPISKTTGDTSVEGSLIGLRKTTAVSGTTGATLLVAQLLTGLIYRTGPTAAYGDTIDTAANIVGAIPNAQVGMGFEFTLVNTVAFANTIAAGTGVTLAGVTAVSASASRRFLLELTNVTAASEAVTLTGLMEGSL